MHNGGWLIVENIVKESVNLRINRNAYGYSIDKWIPAGELSPIPVTSEILPDLGFKSFYQRFTYPCDHLHKIYIDRRSDKFFLTLNNDRFILAEIQSVHHLQNIMFDTFGIEIRLNRYRYSKYLK